MSAGHCRRALCTLGFGCVCTCASCREVTQVRDRCVRALDLGVGDERAACVTAHRDGDIIVIGDVRTCEVTEEQRQRALVWFETTLRDRMSSDPEVEDRKSDEMLSPEHLRSIRVPISSDVASFVDELLAFDSSKGERS